MGSSGMAIRPATKITIDSTAAKIGPSMKNREKSMSPLLAARRLRAGGGAAGRFLLLRRSFVRFHRHAREKDLLKARDDNLVAHTQTGGYGAHAVHAAAQHHILALGLAFLVDHVDVLVVLVVHHRLLVDEYRVEVPAIHELDACVQARRE